MILKIFSFSFLAVPFHNTFTSYDTNKTVPPTLPVVICSLSRHERSIFMNQPLYHSGALRPLEEATMYNLGHVCSLSQIDLLQLQLTASLAESDTAYEAQFALGIAHFHGWGLQQDYKRAYDALVQSTYPETKGKGVAELYLCYQYGLGTLVDTEKAEALLHTVKTTFPTVDFEIPVWQPHHYCSRCGTYWGDPQQGALKIPYSSCTVCDDKRTALAPPIIIPLPEEMEDTDFDTLEENAKNGDWDSATQLGAFYEKGYGIPRDLDKAAALYGLGVKANHTLSLLHAAHLCLEQQNYDYGKLLLGLASSHQNAIGQFSAGQFHELGLSGTIDLKQAVSHYDESIQLGYTPAKYHLAKILMKYPDFAQEDQTPVQLLQESVDEGDDSSLLLLGQCYYEGNGVTKDPKRALELFQEALDKGYVDAHFDIAFWYFRQYDTPSPHQEHYQKSALHHFFQGASLEHQGCIGVLGELYASYGINEETMTFHSSYINPLRALDCFYRSALYSHPGAFLKLGLLHQQGEKLSPKVQFAKDATLARDYFERSSYLGDDFAKKLLDDLDGNL